MADGSVHYFGNIAIDGVAQGLSYQYTSSVGTPSIVEVESTDQSELLKWYEVNYNDEKYYVCASAVLSNISKKYSEWDTYFEEMANWECNVSGYRGKFVAFSFGALCTMIPLSLRNSMWAKGATTIISTTDYTYEENSRKTFGFVQGGYETYGYCSLEEAFLVPIIKASKNASPTINGNDADLGTKNNSFDITYQVSDVDADDLTVTEYLNDSVIRTLEAPALDTDIKLEIDYTTLSNLEPGSSNTIRIEAVDPEGESDTRTYTFTVADNLAPYISGSDSDLGELTSWVPFDYNVIDGDNDIASVNVFLNGSLIKTFNASNDQSYSLELTERQWVSCKKTNNVLSIEAIDLNGSNQTTTRTYTFNRKVDRLNLQLRYPKDTDEAASKITITPQWNITGATPQVFACNNAYDESPVWENVTDVVLAGEAYEFANSEKTADKWGVNIRFIITKDEGTVDDVWMSGFKAEIE